MDRAEASKLAQTELQKIEGCGYGQAVQHVDTAARKSVSAQSGTSYDVELSYHWEDLEHGSILVICTVTSKNWFSHQKLEQSITLGSDAD